MDEVKNKNINLNINFLNLRFWQVTPAWSYLKCDCVFKGFLVTSTCFFVMFLLC